jgi:hypothetical protein
MGFDLNKKAQVNSDLAIISGIIIFLSFIGIMLPYINMEFGQTTFFSNTLIGLSAESQVNTGWFSWIVTSALTYGIYLGSMFTTAFFWSFQLPFWVECVLLVPMRIIMILFIIRFIRGQG